MIGQFMVSDTYLLLIRYRSKLVTLLCNTFHRYIMCKYLKSRKLHRKCSYILAVYSYKYTIS